MYRKDIEYGRTTAGSLIQFDHNTGKIHMEIIDWKDAEAAAMLATRFGGNEGFHIETKKVYSLKHKGYVDAHVIDLQYSGPGISMMNLLPGATTTSE